MTAKVLPAYASGTTNEISNGCGNAGTREPPFRMLTDNAETISYAGGAAMPAAPGILGNPPGNVSAVSGEMDALSPLPGGIVT